MMPLTQLGKSSIRIAGNAVNFLLSEISLDKCLMIGITDIEPEVLNFNNSYNVNSSLWSPPIRFLFCKPHCKFLNTTRCCPPYNLQNEGLDSVLLIGVVCDGLNKIG